MDEYLNTGGGCQNRGRALLLPIKLKCARRGSVRERRSADHFAQARAVQNHSVVQSAGDAVAGGGAKERQHGVDDGHPNLLVD